jgi:hypothetical protein
MLRDEKGRFISTKNTTEYCNSETENKSNKKENDIMMNAREKRIEELKKNGVNVDNFFDLNLRIPFGAEVRLVVDGKEMVIPASNGFIQGIGSGRDAAISGTFGTCMDSIDSSSYPMSGVTVAQNVNVANLSNDPIVQNIMKNGYLYNYKTDGRFVAAVTFKMLNGISYNYKTKQHETGWDAYLRNNYPYMYQFEAMSDELHRLSKMEKDNDSEFALLSNFFTKDVVYQTCKHYINQLRKYINNQPTRKCQGKPYKKLNKYGNVFVSDLHGRVYGKLECALSKIKYANNYKELEDSLKIFMGIMVKLPYNTPKCSQWKDAFKGIGAYKTLNNIVKHHGVVLTNYETGEILNRDESIAYIESLLTKYKGNYWKFHELLKATIKANNFDLKKSIESQK